MTVGTTVQGARPSLTKNQRLVYDALVKANGAIGAYDLLADLDVAGVSAPPIVYRALSQLIEKGLAHKIESKRAYVAREPKAQQSRVSAMAVCNNCGSVHEIPADAMFFDLIKQIQGTGFHAEASTIELQGLCANCSDIRN